MPNGNHIFDKRMEELEKKRKYKHPKLGEITEREINMIAWDRKIQKEWDAEDKRKRAKLDDIINNLQVVKDNLMEDEYGYSPTLKEIIKKLEKFKEEEL